MEIFAFAASLRDESYNRRLLDLAADELRGMGIEVDDPHFSEFDVPLYNQDLEDAEGIPQGARRLADKLENSDGFIIVSPEYNHGIPGTLKNLIDWASRIRPDQPFGGQPGLLMNASPSMVGGNRAGETLRTPLMTLGARLHPGIFSLAQAHQAFDEEGGLENEAMAERLRGTLKSFVEFAGKLGAEL
jgi:NAD(P)H-dependent FMN reductase